MHNCTEAHPAPLVALEAPVELPQRASALAAWHRAKAGGAVDRAEGCRRRSRGELRANGATRGVNACKTARRKTLRWTGSPSWSLRHDAILRRRRMVPCGDAGGSKRGIKRRLKATRAHAARLELRGRTRCLLARDASPACLRGDGCAGGEAPCAIDRNIASLAATIVRLATPSARLPHTDT